MVTTGKLAVVLSGFPRRSETFALNELLALDNDGLLGQVFATNRASRRACSPNTRRCSTGSRCCQPDRQPNKRLM